MFVRIIEYTLVRIIEYVFVRIIEYVFVRIIEYVFVRIIEYVFVRIIEIECVRYAPALNPVGNYFSLTVKDMFDETRIYFWSVSLGL